MGSLIGRVKGTSGHAEVVVNAEGELVVSGDKENPLPMALSGFGSIYSAGMSTGGNSTAVAVANGASWQSPVESVIDQMYAIPAILSDRAVTVTIRQFLDQAGSITQVDDIVVTLAANQRLAKIHTLRGNYWSIQVANTSGQAAQVRVDTYYVPQIPLPDSLGPKIADESLSVSLAIDQIPGTSGSIAAANVDLITGVVNGWFDARAFHSATFEVVGGASISAGQIIFEQSNDLTVTTGAVVWPVEESSSLTPTPQVAAIAIAANTRRMFGGPITAAYVRIRVAVAFAGGMVRAIPNFSQQPYARQVMTVHQPTGANLQVVAAAIAQGVAAAIGTAGAGAWLVRSAAHRTVDIANAAYTTVGMTYGSSIAVDGNVGAHAITTDVTAKGGTNPRLFVRLRGSFDNANWVTVYDSPVLTTEVAANKVAGHCPLIPIEFPWIQYGRDLRGVSPSVTHSVTRMTRPGVEGVRQRRLNDRVLSLIAAINTASTEMLYVAGCNRLQISCGAIAGMTTAAAVKIQVCEADPGVTPGNWIDLPGATLTLSAGARTLSAIFEIAATIQYARLAIATQGAAITVDTYELALMAWET